MYSIFPYKFVHPGCVVHIVLTVLYVWICALHRALLAFNFSYKHFVSLRFEAYILNFSCICHFTLVSWLHFQW
jgi:hypothetical protein